MKKSDQRNRLIRLLMPSVPKDRYTFGLKTKKTVKWYDL